MKSCCNDQLTFDIGDVCPLCGQTVTADNPEALVVKRPTLAAPVRRGYIVPTGFRFAVEHNAVAAGLAEQKVRKFQQTDGTFRQRPGKKRQAMPGPEGRRQRRGLVAVRKSA
jgi:hypothetical protein